MNLLLENALYFYYSSCISHDSRCIFTIHEVPKTVGNQILCEQTQFASEENPTFIEETQSASEEEAFARSDDHFACEEDLFARSDDLSACAEDHFGWLDALFARLDDHFGCLIDLFASEDDLFGQVAIFKVCEVNLISFSNKVFKELVAIKRFFS